MGLVNQLLNRDSGNEAPGEGSQPGERAYAQPLDNPLARIDARAVAVTHGGELLGALSLHKPPNEPLTSTEDELIRHLASQAGLVLRNAALTAELRATIDELRASREHRDHRAWQRPARNGRPAGRARGRPPHPFTARSRKPS